MARPCLAAFAALALATGLAACDKKTPTSPSNCNVSVSGAPTGSVGAAASEFTVSVTAAAGCSWSASSSASFVSIVGSSTGSGDGSVRFSIQTNSGAARQGTLQVAGQTLIVNQVAGSACTFTVTPEQVAISGQPADVSLDVAVASGNNCAWTATTSANFITIKEGTSGTGAGRVVLSVPINNGEARVGSLTVAGRTVTLLQESTQPPAVSCEFVTSPSSVHVPPTGIASVVITVTKTQGGSNCVWLARKTGSFITILGPASGIGSGSFTVAVAENTGPARVGDVFVNTPNVGLVHINQDAGLPCAFSIFPTGFLSPLTALLPTASGGSFPVTITKTQGTSACPWTAQPQASFLTVNGDASGVDSGSTTLVVAPNFGAARSGAFLIAGQTVIVNQAAGGAQGMVAVLSFQSDPADAIGDGFSRTYTVTSPSFNLTIDAGRSELVFEIPPGTGDYWKLAMEAPVGQQLSAGFYDRAESWPNQVSSLPGLSFSGNHRICDTITGRFLVGEIVHNSNNVLQRFHAKFDQHCGGQSPGLRGEIWIDAGGSTSVPAMADLPPTPATPTTFLSFVSDSGDYIGGGATRNYTLGTMKFSAWLDNNNRHIAVSVQPILGGGPEWWSLNLMSPSGSQLVPGTYNNATRWPLQGAGAGLDFSGTGRGCNTLTGSFVVLEASYGPQGEVYRFRATFEQHCEGATPALRGEIYIVADPWR